MSSAVTLTICHQSQAGPRAAKALERQAMKEGMVRMVSELRTDPQAARTLRVRFIRKVNERIDAGEVADSWLESILKSVRLAFELNEILVPCKKHARRWSRD